MTENSMTFILDDEHQTLHDAAAAVFAKSSPEERVREIERSGRPYDAELWGDLLSTGLLDAVLPESVGGGGLGLVGLSVLARCQGTQLSPVPLVPTVVAAMTLARFDFPDNNLLDAIREGSARVTVVEPDEWNALTAERDGDHWRLNGSVPQAYVAGACTHALVVASDGADLRSFLVELDREGIRVEQFAGISRLVHAALTFDRVSVTVQDMVGGAAAGGTPARWLRQRLLVGLAAVEVGLCREAVRRTAEYTSQRMQFERPLSTNQGVAMRAADAHIDTEAMRLTMLDAAWNLDQDDDAWTSTHIASWWAREGGFRVVHTTQHLHGGMGADMDNYIHRYFLWARELDIVAGPAPAILTELGASLGTPVVSSSTGHSKDHR